MFERAAILDFKHKESGCSIGCITGPLKSTAMDGLLFGERYTQTMRKLGIR
ncbi:hypothetical protein ACVNRC_24225 [Burkholderia pyrrocinia]